MELDPVTKVRNLASKERCPSALIVDFFVSVRIYICDKDFWFLIDPSFVGGKCGLS